MMQTLVTFVFLLLAGSAMLVIAGSLIDEWAALRRAFGLDAPPVWVGAPARFRRVTAQRRARVLRVSPASPTLAAA